MHTSNPDSLSSQESFEKLFDKEIRAALSPAWAKSIQELLPGYLPFKPESDYTHEELEHYRIAYRIVGRLVESGEVEEVFEEEVPETPNTNIENEHINRPKFKLVTQGGRRDESGQVSLGATIIPET